MDPIAQFKSDRVTNVQSYGQNEQFKALSSQWRSASMAERYVYNFDWLGRPIIQYPQDIQAIQELIWQTRPDLVIETGIAHGGSLILSASMLAMLDMCDAIEAGVSFDPRQSKRKVIGIDIDIRDYNRVAIENHPMATRIAMVEGSSVDPNVIETVKQMAIGYERVMVCLDSMHTHDHVLTELRAYAPLTTSNCYCIVFDTFVEELEPGFFNDRPWDVGNNPMTALRVYLAENPAFEIDAAIADKLMVTVAPNGFLRRV